MTTGSAGAYGGSGGGKRCVMRISERLALSLTLGVVAAAFLAGPSTAARDRSALLYKHYCATCHAPENAGQDPSTDDLRKMTAERILASLETGSMASRASDWTPAERKALARWLAGKAASSSSAKQRTLRVDYIHTGNATRESFHLDGLVREGPWPGPPDRRIDETGLGVCFFKVFDSATGKLLYSRGFASIFGEWRQTAEARKTTKSFHESLRFPMPEHPIKVVLESRNRDNRFEQVWSVSVDPDTAADTPPLPKGDLLWAVMENGSPANKADLLLLGDGYTASEMQKWHRDAERLVKTLFAVSPFRERRRDFNVWAIDTPAVESGVSRPSDGIRLDSPIGASYDALGSERYVLVMDNKRLREIAAAAPYEFLVVVVNDRKYGGGGIYNLYATVAADNAFTPYILVHELGHHIAALADEYYTSDVAYQEPEQLVEPWEVNITADPHAAKWSDLITPGIPLPTPWPKKAFEEIEAEIQARRRQIRRAHRAETEMETLFSKERARISKLLGSCAWAGKVGAFEGAGYRARGYYRPRVDCIMFSRNENGFCPVCRRAINRMIDLYAGKSR